LLAPLRYAAIHPFLLDALRQDMTNGSSLFIKGEKPCGGVGGGGQNLEMIMEFIIDAY
jgi:hypothetical protein